jgi:ribonuclease R
MKKRTKVKGNKLDHKSLQVTLRGFLRSHGGKSYNAKQIIRKLKMTNNRDTVEEALEQLAKAGRIKSVGPGQYMYTADPNSGDFGSHSKGDKIGRGVVDLTRSGAAFIVVPDLDRDVFVPPHKVHMALQGDTVDVRYYLSRRGRPEGEIIKVVEHLNDHFIGSVRLTANGGVLVPDKQGIPFDIYLPKEELEGIADGEKLLARVTVWPEPGSKYKSPKGVVAGRFKGESLNDVEMQAILVHHNFPLFFTEEVLAETAKLPGTISEQEITRRRDFRDVLTITIDPEDAKDFDDALSYKSLPDGGCEIGVHIADVTHYVQPGTALDEEAYHRATSVYLVDRVLPMLPERISNEICSLRPNEESLTFGAVFTFDNKDVLRKRWIGKTVIFSDRRFSYEEAQGILDTGEGDHAEALTHLNRIAEKLRKKRFREGSISFESEEVKFRLNEDGVPLEIFTKERKDAHLLVEDFMLLANKEVAAYIHKKEAGSEIPFVYRVHDLPDPDKLEDFKNFALEVGFKMDVQTPAHVVKSFNKLAQAARTDEKLRILEPLAIRTMAKADYSTNNIGHYGLGFEDYTHFTSPIRRYSDVLVHRILEKNLQGVHREDKERLEAKCRHVSKQERHANDAERESIKYKQVEYIEKHVGEIFEGQISGMMDRGIFVQLKGNLVEGFAPFSNFPEPFDIDEGRLKATGRYTSQTLKMGDIVQVQIMFADINRRQIEMRMIFA